MDIDKVAERLAGIPYTTPDMGRELYDFVQKEKPERILELGFAHGTSTCYLAAALDELGRGQIVTMDRRSAADREPNLETLLDELGLARYVTPVYAERSFTWELHHLIDRYEEPIFDFVFNDGGHHWDVAALSFFLTDRLLRPGGWMLFDDLEWTIAGSPEVRDRPWAKQRPRDERETAQVGEVFRLLVQRTPEYPVTHTTREGRWGWARKDPRPLVDPKKTSP
jgi:predicted O-methyltransferase YrrM